MRDRRFLITGAASGIGKATTQILANLGAELILVDYNEEGLHQFIKQQSSDKLHPLVLDLSEPEQIRPAIENAVKKYGKLNGMAHIAGIPYITPLKAIQREKADKLYRVNQYAAVELIKTFASNKIHSNDGGSAVLISSVYGVVGSAANVAYAMTKAAIIGITKALSIELASKRIRVNCIAPGFIKTKMMEENSFRFDDEYMQRLNNLHPLGLGEAEDIANGVVFLLSDMSKWMTGAVMNIDGGFTAQ
ncbi:MAG: short-chain dehydrogenase [Bacteroidales bacterium 52_46]|nr:MAG: short-chain dehydrogenase [Bacteroidales bacterium 52_46]